MKIGLFGIMFLIMFALKLAGPMAAVSWWIVTAPLWAGPVLLFLVLFVIALFVGK